MYLIQLLLPRLTNAGTPIPEAIYAITRAELVGKFEGITAYLRSPASGAWVAPAGHIEHDDVVMVEVLAATFDRAWWRHYAHTLAQRFDQQEMHIRALPAEVP